MLCGGRGVSPRPTPHGASGPNTIVAAQSTVWASPLLRHGLRVAEVGDDGSQLDGTRRSIHQIFRSVCIRTNAGAIGMAVDKPVVPLLRKAERDILPGGDPNTPWRRLAYQLRQAPSLRDLLALFRANRINRNVWRPHLTALVFIRASALLYPKALASMATSGGDGSAAMRPSPSLKIDADSMLQIMSVMLNKLSVRQIHAFHIARMLVVMSWIQWGGERCEHVESTLVRELLRKQGLKLARVAMLDPPLYGRLVRALAQLAPRDNRLWVELQRLTLAALLQASAEAKGPTGAGTGVGPGKGGQRLRLWGTDGEVTDDFSYRSTTPDCSTEDLANMAFGFAAADRAMPPLFDALRDAALARDLPASADTLANLLWAWGRAQLPAGQLALLAAVSFRPLLETAPPRAVGRVLWAMAALGFRSQAFLAAASEAIVRRKLVFGSTQELVNVCWAFSQLGVRAVEEGRGGQGAPGTRRPALGFSAKEEAERAKPRGARRRAPEHVYDSSTPASPANSLLSSEGDAAPMHLIPEDAATGADIPATAPSGPNERPSICRRGSCSEDIVAVAETGGAPTAAVATALATAGMDPTRRDTVEPAQRQHRDCGSVSSASGEDGHGSVGGGERGGERWGGGAGARRQLHLDHEDEASGNSSACGAEVLKSASSSRQWQQHLDMQHDAATASSSAASWSPAMASEDTDSEGASRSRAGLGRPSPDAVHLGGAVAPSSTALAAATPLSLEPLSLSAMLDAEAARSRAAAQRPPADPSSPYELYRYLAHCFVNGHIDGHEGHRCRWKMSNCQLSVLVASFARAGYGNKSMFYTVARMAMRRMASLSPTDLTLILTAHARVRVRHDALFDAACAFVEARCRDFTPRQLADVLWALQQMQLHTRYAQLSEAVRQRHGWQLRPPLEQQEWTADARHAGGQGGSGSGGAASDRMGSDAGGRRGSEGLGVPPSMLRLHVPSHLLDDGEWDDEEEGEGREEGDGSMWAAGRLQGGEYWGDMGRRPAELQVAGGVVGAGVAWACGCGYQERSSGVEWGTQSVAEQQGSGLRVEHENRVY